MRIKILSTGVVAACLMAMPASAEMHGGKKHHGGKESGMHHGMQNNGKHMGGKHMGEKHADKMFQRMDSNDDGKLSREEFMDKHRAMFDQADMDDDGMMTRDEMMSMRDKMRKRHGKGMKHRNEAED